MNRQLLLARLAEAKEHAKEGAERIARQKRIVAALKLAQRDARMAVNLLETMQALQASAEKRCSRLQRQLAEIEAMRSVKERELRLGS